MREVEELMDRVLKQLDQDHTAYGEPGILNDRVVGVLRAAASGFCQQNPRSTISIEAVKAYRYMRTLRVRTAIEP